MRLCAGRLAALCLVGGLLATQTVGCSQNTNTTETKEEAAAESQATSEAGTETGSTADSAQKEPGEGTVTARLGEGREMSVTYHSEDLDSSWDEEDAVGIIMEENGITVEGEGAGAAGNVVTIEKAGTYVVSGSLSDGQIRIEADDDALVHLVLNGVELSNSTTSPIYGTEKCKVVLTLEAGTTNVISDSGEYQFETEGEDEPNAAIFTKGDLTINGAGTLEVYGNYQCGIRSKDNLTVASGVVQIQAQEDALKGRDSVVIRDGLLNLTSGKDAVKSNNDEDPEKGYIWIDGGEITIAAEDDGIQAETSLVINGGEIEITDSQEALSGKTVDILGGVIHAKAQDDGINSAATVATEQEKMMDQEGVYTRIAGGEIWLNASADGIDSNGDLYMEGGTLYLSGPVSGADGILDYNGSASITGGTVFAAGSSGMMQTFGDDSAQNYLVVYYTETQKGGTAIQLTDDSGEELGSFAPEKDFNAVIISMPEIETGNTYHVITGSDTVDLEVTGIETVSGEAAGGMGGFGGRGGMGGFGGGRGEGGQGRPEGMETQGENGQEPPEGMAPGGGRGQRGQMADGETRPEGMTRPDGQTLPEGMTPPDGETPPDGQMPPEGMTPPDGETPPDGQTIPEDPATSGT